MREKLSALYGKDGTKAVLSSLISILIGMAVGSVIVPGLETKTPMETSLNELMNARMNADIRPDLILGITVLKKAFGALQPKERAASSMAKSKLASADDVTRMM